MCRQQRYIPGETGNVQGRDRVGIVEGSCGYRARGVNIRGKFVLSRNTGYKTRGVATWLNVVLTVRVAYPEANVQVRDLVRVVGSVFEENSFYRAPGDKWDKGDLCRVPPAAVHNRRARQCSGTQKAVYPLSRTSKLEARNMIRSSVRRYHTCPPHSFFSVKGIFTVQMALTSLKSLFFRRFYYFPLI